MCYSWSHYECESYGLSYNQNLRFQRFLMRDAHWIFGYGSLMWHPGFEFSENRPAAITGWIRRFWQGSTNHRGVPGAPGRVVSLVPDESAVCRGMAYRVDSKAYRAAVETLRAREQGYVGVPTSIVLDGTPRHADRGLVFIANPDNPSFSVPHHSSKLPRKCMKLVARADQIPSM